MTAELSDVRKAAFDGLRVALANIERFRPCVLEPGPQFLGALIEAEAWSKIIANLEAAVPDPPA